jgi:ubiquinone/menaquinone biosynthesis C-methylase UbiE
MKIRNSPLTYSEPLILLPLNEYIGVDRDDPIRQYQKPFFGRYYRQRVEMCLHRCKGGERVLEVGYGSGVTFLNLIKKYKEVHGIDLKANAQEITAMFASKGVQVSLRQGNLLQMPYEDAFFDTVLLISILEHLQPADLLTAFQEIRRVLKPGGQVVYGVPVDSQITRIGFLMLGYDIRKHHFSNQQQISSCAAQHFMQNAIIPLKAPFLRVRLYEVGDFTKGT